MGRGIAEVRFRQEFCLDAAQILLRPTDCVGLDCFAPSPYHATMANNDAEIIHKLHAEIRRLNRQFDVLKRAILEQYPEGEITKDDLQTLIALVRDLGMRAKGFDDLTKPKYLFCHCVYLTSGR
jgi:hypothetical protein